MSHPESQETSERLVEAFAFAARLHGGQVRKGTDIPYVSHLMAVAALVQQNGGDEEQVIAALLHDGPEDQGGEETLKEIRRLFGDRVGNIVAECSDTFEKPKPPWLDRKRRYLEHLETASEATLLVSAADKVHNLGCITRDFRTVGDTLWKRFNNGCRGTVWYYHRLLQVYEKRELSHLEGLLDDLRRSLDELGRLLEESRSTRSKPGDPSSIRYTVLVDDNYHYQDESERYKLGMFETAEDAIEACRRHVDQWLVESYEPGFSAGQLYGKYKMFGEGPFIVSEDEVPVRFSAWDYAKEKCEDICGSESS